MQDVRNKVFYKNRNQHELCSLCDYTSVRCDIPYWGGVIKDNKIFDNLISQSWINNKWIDNNFIQGIEKRTIKKSKLGFKI